MSNAHMYRRLANSARTRADKWLVLAKNKSYDKKLRIIAARRYRVCMREVNKYSNWAKQQNSKETRA